MNAPAGELAALRRRGFWLEYASMAWMVAEAAVAISAGVIASSIALVGFGLDSVIELFAAAIVVWRRRRPARRRGRRPPGRYPPGARRLPAPPGRRLPEARTHRERGAAARNEGLARTAQWLDALLGTIEPAADRRLVQAYATWHVMRRLHAAAGRDDRPRTPTAQARNNVRAAAALHSSPPTGSPDACSCSTASR